MDGPTAELLRRIAEAARAVPGPIMEHFCERLEGLPPDTARGATGSLLRTVTQQSARDILAELLSFWRRNAPGMRPDQLAWALRAASTADEERVRRQSVELVWTGPVAGNSALRRTEQALLELIESARRSLILVTFAAYKVPQISEALLRAAGRGVEIVFIAESPDAGAGKVSFAGFQALGDPLASRARLFIWPREKRVVDVAGHFGTLHAKCAVADKEAAFISSANLTGYALTLNMELGVLIRGGDMPPQVAEHIRGLMQAGVLVQVVR
ncbi:MAG TPA: DISARM system phospholipase D-like protein DrmC [Armatimonadota bacterium]|nr:DISARM system phospholipase D-like protein DrmC [Armatimonadota bacterium]